MKLKVFLVVLVSMTCNGTLHADYDPSDLKKLFTDKKQRAQLDAARTGSHIDSNLQQPSDKVNVSGYMTRSDGKSVVWVNNKNTLDGPKVGDIKVHSSTIGNDKQVRITVNNKNILLKPGQVWSDDAGNIIDNN